MTTKNHIMTAKRQKRITKGRTDGKRAKMTTKRHKATT